MSGIWLFVIAISIILLIASHGMAFLWGVKCGVKEMVKFDKAVWKQAEKATKEHKELTAQLRRMSVETGSLMCLGCGYEHNCGIHGCAVLNAAARALENQEVSARWFDRGSLSSRCSNCGCKSTKESKYCPNCGARMEE